MWRDSDRKILGVVTLATRVIQNEEAFAFYRCSAGRGRRLRNSSSPQREEGCGCLQGFQGNTSLLASVSAHTWWLSNTHDGSAIPGVIIDQLRLPCAKGRLSVLLHTTRIVSAVFTAPEPSWVLKKYHVWADTLASNDVFP